MSLSDTAEVTDSRPEPDGLVTESCDQRDTSGALSKRAGRAPADLESLIIWKIGHIVQDGCADCYPELGELLRDWRDGC